MSVTINRANGKTVYTTASGSKLVSYADRSCLLHPAWGNPFPRVLTRQEAADFLRLARA